MSTLPARAPAPLTEEEVAGFLKNDIDFFSRHLPLLAQLRLPHLREAGGTVSLVERQVDVLREQRREAEQKLRDFVGVARGNTVLTEKIHRLAQRLIGTRTLAAVVEATDRTLREDFEVQEFTLVLFREPVTGLESARVRFAPREEANARGLDTLLAAGKPRCGSVRDTQRDWLFPGNPGAIASAALVPLGAQGAHGLLALGAPDVDRYNPSMSTDFLSRIGELVAAALAAEQGPAPAPAAG